jgi:molecular chaperone DnaK
MSEIAIGIDLGTSNSCVAVMQNGEVEVLTNAYGEATTASVVAFREDDGINVGNAAKANIIHNPTRTVHSSKRLIGRYFFSEEVKKAQAICSYQIAEAENHALRIQVGEEKFSLPEIAAMILSEMKSIAEARLGQPVTKAVITVPAYFNDNQRQATKDAGRIAGLEVLRILNEPTAAALSYGFGRGLSQRVAVWDLGGGTFDISVLEIGEDVFEVLSTAGDTFLGGEDFDDRLIDLLADEFAASTGINLRNDPFALEKLKVAAEGAKKGLSLEDEVEIRIPDVITGDDGKTHSIERTLTSQEYGTLVNDLIQRTFKVCDEALQQAGVVARDLDGVMLVGGPTRLPIIRATVREYFQQDPREGIDPDRTVAMGAAIHAASLVSPDQEAYLLDVTPLSLRIGIVGGIAETVIERNTPVPIEQTRTFTTFNDNQESVEIKVFQGESQEAKDNELLGQFSFSDFEKGARGEVQIDVTFEINTDGIVSVTATDRATGRAASTRITLSSGLSENELADIMDEGRTERVEPTTLVDEDDQVIGAIPLKSVPADTPVLFEETRESKADLLGENLLSEDCGILPLDESPATTVPVVPDPSTATTVPEPIVAEPDETPIAVTEETTQLMSESSMFDVSEASAQVGSADSDEIADFAGNFEENEVDPVAIGAEEIDDEADVDELDLIDVDLDDDAEDLDLLEIDDGDELGGPILELGPESELADTEPVMVKGDLFESPGIDLSELDDDSEDPR